MASPTTRESWTQTLSAKEITQGHIEEHIKQIKRRIKHQDLCQDQLSREIEEARREERRLRQVIQAVRADLKEQYAEVRQYLHDRAKKVEWSSNRFWPDWYKRYTEATSTYETEDLMDDMMALLEVIKKSELYVTHKMGERQKKSQKKDNAQRRTNGSELSSEGREKSRVGKIPSLRLKQRRNVTKELKLRSYQGQI